jgi:hypothetical protein
MDIRVGEKRGIIPSEGNNPKLYFDVTEENVDNVNRYDLKPSENKEWLFTDKITDDIIEREHYRSANVIFTEQTGDLNMEVGLMRAGRRSRKVKKSKTSKKRPTARRRRSSKARKSCSTRRR